MTTAIVYWLARRLEANALTQSELVAVAPEGIVIQAGGRLLFANQAFADLVEAETPAELLGRNVIDLLHPEDREAVRRRMSTLLAEGEPVRLARQTLITLKGNTVLVETVAVPFRYDDHDAGLAFVRDITDREAAALERTLFSQAIEQATDAIVITDAAGTIIYVNPGFVRASGFDVDEAIGQPASLQRSHVHGQTFFDDMWRQLLEGKAWQGHIVNRRKDDSVYTEDVSITPIFDAGGNIVNYIAVKRDITREADLERQLNQAQKMETVGRLAGGIAHDYNNMLSVIQGYAELAMESLGPEHPVHNDLTEVKSAAERSARLTQQLLGFARQQPINPRVIKLEDTVANTLRMLERLIGEDITLTWRPASDSWPIKVDPGQIDQVLANLAVNARDAIEAQGEIVIETANVELSNHDVEGKPGMKAGDYVQLRFSDNGRGMEDSLQQYIFEPFFSTKSDRGTGLGLSTVYGIVKQNDGFIDVDSKPGKGATFIVYFPKCEEVASEEAPASVAAGDQTADGRTILVVEDEAALLRLCRRMLEKSGYSVIACDNPGEAVALAQQHTGDIDALLTDLVMPDMNGRQLAEAVRSIHPDIKVLYTSGYTPDLQQNILKSGEPFLQKPWTPDSLTTKMAEILQGPD